MGKTTETETRRVSWGSTILHDESGNGFSPESTVGELRGASGANVELGNRIQAETSVSSGDIIIENIGDQSNSSKNNQAKEINYDQLFKRALHILKEASITSVSILSFMLSIKVFGTSAKIAGGDLLVDFFQFVEDPFVALMFGWALTIGVQSSSLSTAMVTSLCDENLISPYIAVYVLIGANLGTASTNTIASILTYRSKSFPNTLSINTMHDQINVLLLVLCSMLQLRSSIAPSGTFTSMTKGMLKGYNTALVPEDMNPLTAWISELSKSIIGYDKDVLKKRAAGYICKERLTNSGFLAGVNDEGAATIGILLGVSGMAISLKIINAVLRRNISNEDAKRFTDYLKEKSKSIIVGLSMLLTIILMSSSSFTILILPFIVSGIIDREAALPAFMGTNIGTTVSTLLVALSLTSNPKAAMQCALSHLFCNIFTVLLISLPVLNLNDKIIKVSEAFEALLVLDKRYGLLYTLSSIALPFIALGGLWEASSRDDSSLSDEKIDCVEDERRLATSEEFSKLKTFMSGVIGSEEQAPIELHPAAVSSVLAISLLSYYYGLYQSIAAGQSNKSSESMTDCNNNLNDGRVFQDKDAEVGDWSQSQRSDYLFNSGLTRNDQVSVIEKNDEQQSASSLVV